MNSPQFTFDTAHGYGNGDCERTRSLVHRARLTRQNCRAWQTGAHLIPATASVTPYDITADLMDSLARQKTDFIDLYVLHRDDPSKPVGPIIEVLNEHQAAASTSLGHRN
ncbi:MAG: aldo/keto reductase [Caldilineaceae bacterium]